jgi:hypothetical protein
MSAPDTIRIAMWSGPRNISTAMMRSFEARGDCAVSDEPFYAAYLAATGLDHPMREDVLASQSNDPAVVAEAMTGAPPVAAPIWYQKHMTQHMLADFPLAWSDRVANVFLIRAPEPTLASYAQKRSADFTLDEIGLPAQLALFNRAADRLGRAPPVIEGADVLKSPAATLRALCAILSVPFDLKMLHWPAGRRASDGVWAPAWYDAVERSTGFGPPRTEAKFDDLDDTLKPLAAAARPIYEVLARHKLNVRP